MTGRTLAAMGRAAPSAVARSSAAGPVLGRDVISIMQQDAAFHDRSVPVAGLLRAIAWLGGTETRDIRRTGLMRLHEVNAQYGMEGTEENGNETTAHHPSKQKPFHLRLPGRDQAQTPAVAAVAHLSGRDLGPAKLTAG
jgi:hypothetical protein